MRVTALVSLALALAASSVPLSARDTSSLGGDTTGPASQVGGKGVSAADSITHDTSLHLRTTTGSTSEAGKVVDNLSQLPGAGVASGQKEATWGAGVGVGGALGGVDDGVEAGALGPFTPASHKII